MEWLQIEPPTHPPYSDFACWIFFVLQVHLESFSNMDDTDSFVGKMQAFLPTPSSGGKFAFSVDWLVPSKAQLALMIRKCNVVFAYDYKERFTERLKYI